MRKYKTSDTQFIITLIKEIGLCYNLSGKISPTQKARIFREIFELLSIMV